MCWRTPFPSTLNTTWSNSCPSLCWEYLSPSLERARQRVSYLVRPAKHTYIKSPKITHMMSRSITTLNLLMVILPVKEDQGHMWNSTFWLKKCLTLGHTYLVFITSHSSEFPTFNYQLYLSPLNSLSHAGCLNISVQKRKMCVSNAKCIVFVSFLVLSFPLIFLRGRPHALQDCVDVKGRGSHGVRTEAVHLYRL